MFFILFFNTSFCWAQKEAVIAFYNCENFFDTINDPGKRDGEYTPEGANKWDTKKYATKIAHLSRVILAMNNWVGPDIIGLCEVEKRAVLDDLIKKSNLVKQGYEIIHQESPDNRGIDVAMLYKEKSFNPLLVQFIRVDIPGSSRPTRDILYAKGIIKRRDTVHIFINHWPSRFGGEAVSAPKRMFVAQLIRKKVDSISSSSPGAKIIITGDLNDGTSDPSIVEGLRAKGEVNQLEIGDLFNASYRLQHQFHLGTHKFREEWNLFDQFIVSQSLLKKSSLYFNPDNTFIFSPEWLQETDDVSFGKRPFRTFRGKTYTGGYSDHFGVYIKLSW